MSKHAHADPTDSSAQLTLHGSVFNEDQLSAMRSAVDAVCREIGISDGGELRETVARAALSHTSFGPVDGARLIDLLLAQFGRKASLPYVSS